MTGNTKAPAPRAPTIRKASPVEIAVNRISTELVRLDAKLDTALSFRQDMRREYEEHRRYIERDLKTIIESRKPLEEDLKDLEGRVRALEIKDNTQDGYFQSISFVRDALFGVVLAVIGAGVWY